MHGARPADSATRLFAEGEVEEFRLLLRQHANVELSFDDARILGGQLLRVLALIREVAVSAASAEDGSVDSPPCQLAGTDQSIGSLSG